MLHDLGRIALHFPIGLLVAFAIEVSGVLSVMLFLCFLVYEVNEDWHIRNGAYKDIAGALIGIFVGIIILLFLEFLA